jgi:hypothetical protein
LWGVSVLLAVGILGGGWLLWRRLSTLRHTQEQVAAGARAALADLEAGETLRDVIVRCYAAMNTAVADRRGINRQQAVTPREFEQRLITQAELPEHAVRRLTRLFEQVRYGAHNAGEREKAEARDCLQAIIHACEVHP